MTKKAVFCILACLFSRTYAFPEGFLYLNEGRTGRLSSLAPEIIFHHADIEVGAASVSVRVEQKFSSGSAFLPSAEYLFPVPKGRQFSSFRAEIDGKEVRSEYMDELKTREFCEREVRIIQDPSVLSYCRGAFYRFTVPSFSPREKKQIIVTFSEKYESEKKSSSWRYPLGGGFSHHNPHEVRIRVTASKKNPMRALRSLSHPVSVSETPETVTAVYESKNIPDSDFSILMDRGDGPLFSSYREEGLDGYFMFSVDPMKESPPVEKDIVYLVDTSGSMAGKKLEGVSRSIMRSVRSLGERDRFQVIGFGSSASPLFKSPAKADAGNRAAAESFLKGVRAGGGTNLDEALKLGLDLPNDPSRPFYIVLVTDGRPTVGEAGEELLVAQAKKLIKANTRLFILGIGHELNSRLLDRLASISNGKVNYAESGADAETSLDSLCTSFQFPVLTEITAAVKGVKASYLPSFIPDLTEGCPVTLFGRYNGDGAATLVLQGKVAEKSRTFVYPLTFPVSSREQPSIPSIWFARKEGDVLGKMRIRGESSDAASEMASAARLSGIFAPAARFCLAEDEERKSARGELRGPVITEAASAQTKSAWKKEAQSSRSVFGETGVHASAEAARLAGTNSLSDIAADGQEPQIKTAGGRAFYRCKAGWSDSALPAGKDMPTRKVLFGSDEYFDLLNQEPGIEELLTVGRQVRFLYRGRIFEITAP